MDRLGVAWGVRTDRGLPERIARIEDPVERQSELERYYKKENVHLGQACASAAVNAARLPTPVVVLAAPRVVLSAFQIRAAFNNRDIIEDLALEQGVDIHDGPRRRHTAEGVIKGVLR